MQFPAFPGPELVNREALLWLKKNANKKMKHLTNLAIIIIGLQLFVFQLILKRSRIGKSVRITYLYHIYYIRTEIYPL